MSYRMSYTLRAQPPKEQDDLGPDEGLADSLVVASILGRPGHPEPLSIRTFQLGPAGVEDLAIATAMHVAMAMLFCADRLGSPLAAAGLAAIRKAMGVTEPGAPI